MIILGLDLSMSKTGVAVFDGWDLIHTELIEPKHKMPKPKTDRSNYYGLILADYYHRFNQLITEYEPEYVAIERGFTKGNNATQVLYRLHGVANMACRNIQTVNYPALSVKKSFTGKGFAKKHEMILFAKVKYGVDVSEDEADAIAVAECLIKELNK